MTPSRVRVRRLAVALATAACLLGTSLPAVAGDKDKKPAPPPAEPGPAPAPEPEAREQSQPAPAQPAPAPTSPGRVESRGGRSRGGDTDSDDGGSSKSKKRDGGDDSRESSGSGDSSGGSVGSRGTATPTGSGASTPAPQPATPQPAAPQPAPSGEQGSGTTTQRPSRRNSTGGDRGGSPDASERRSSTGSAPAPVIRATRGGAAVTPLGPVGPAVVETVSQPPAPGSAGRATDFRADDGGQFPPVTRTVEQIVEVVPTPVKGALLALALVALMFAVHSFMAGARARRLARQREVLLDEVGLLQAALLPSVPARLGDLVSTVAYRPADGPAAGGDFYDAFAFDGGRVGVIVGDISGHGREALARTALMRYTLRAYLDAGLEPRAALKVAGSALDDDLGTDFATVVVAVYDPEAGTLTYASAGHPPPILLGPPAHEPATSYSSPPVGVGATTGLRQTTVGLPPGSIACFFTDGMTDARVDGELLGRELLTELLAELGPDATAPELLDRVAQLAERTPDDMAACILHAHGDGAGTLRVEELEVSRADIAGDSVPRFLRECGVPIADMPALFREATDVARQSGTAVLRVRLGDWRPGVDVLPGNVETIAAAVQRRANVAKSS